MHQYRSCNCSALSISDEKKIVRLAGWIYRKRDHGQLLFIDLKDIYGVTQLVVEDPDLISKLEKVTLQSVITVTGQVRARSADTVNPNLATGEIEVYLQDLVVESISAHLPFNISDEQEVSEELRLEYRFLDLRRDKMQKHIMLRSKIVHEIRNIMHEEGFFEIQTPILTASSPEGARDFLVPSRLHPGKFYALPQAPQQFKQLLMVAGFDKYFQIAPCFRDEDARADRSPGEFYQLDVEMSFATQEDIFACIEKVLMQLFNKFTDAKISNAFPRISYDDAMIKYGSDKPDLRNPIEMVDLTSFFQASNFEVFKKLIDKGFAVRGIPVKGAAAQPRSFFQKMEEFAIGVGAQGLGYITFADEGPKGPIVKFLSNNQLEDLQERSKLGQGDTVFFLCHPKAKLSQLAGSVRNKLGELLGLINEDEYRFCWVVDFPFYEWDEESSSIIFSHNPFSMPQVDMEFLNQDLTKEELLSIKAYQYDIVCNGIELSSGALRSHKIEMLRRTFELAGYKEEDLDSMFPGMIRALQFGAPPHGGLAPGIDRMIMLMLKQPNLREITAFPLNQKGQDLLMGAPSKVSDRQLKEVHIRLAETAKESN